MLRHTFVTTMLDAGVDLRDVQVARLVEGTEGEDPTLVELRQLELDHLRARDRQWGQNRD